jgi:hypothetical protein
MNEMTAQQGTATADRRRPDHTIVTPLTKVNLALPFSKISIEEPGKDLAELASIRAEILAARLR